MSAPINELDRQALVFGRMVQWFFVHRHGLLDRELCPASKALLGAISYVMNYEKGVAALKREALEEITGYSQKQLSRASTELKRRLYVETYCASIDDSGTTVVHYVLGRGKLSEIRAFMLELQKFLPQIDLLKELENAAPDAANDYPKIGAVIDTDYPKIGAPTPKNEPVSSEEPRNDYPKIGPRSKIDYPKIGLSLPQKCPSQPQNWAGHQPPSSTTEESKKMKMVIGASLLSPGVELPTAIREAVEAGTSKVAAASLMDAIEAALARGVKPFQIEMSLRKSATAAVTQRGGKDPTPSEVLTKAARYVENSDGEKLSDGPTGRNPRARNLDTSFDVPDLNAMGKIEVLDADVYFAD